jgi:thymidylate synthase
MKNGLDEQYIDLLKDILNNGVEKNTRNGKTLSVFGRSIRYKFKDGKFPLLTTKKMAFKTMVVELLWFLRGDTNIKFLLDYDCHIWDGDCFANYVRTFSKYVDSLPENSETEFIINKDKFINKIKTDDEFAKKWGELGPIYGAQWRRWAGKAWTPKGWLDENGIIQVRGGNNIKVEYNSIDQIQNLINELKTNPDSRRLLVTAWNPSDLPEQVLPPCHYGFQLYTRELSEDERLKLWDTIFGFANEEQKNQFNTDVHLDTHGIPKRAISLMWNQRSVDTFLGLPFNIASYGLLLEIIAKEVNMLPDELIGNLGDVHLYSNHIEQAKEQISREPFELPTLLGKDEYHYLMSTDISFSKKIEEFKPDFFKVENYKSHPAIKAPLSN